MDEKLSKYIENLSISKIIKVVIIILMSIISAENIFELYSFLITIPVLEWILNLQVLLVLKQALIYLLLFNTFDFIKGLYISYSKKYKNFDEKITYLDKSLNIVFIIAVLIYGLIIIYAITDNLEISIYIHFPIMGILLIMVLINGFVFTRLKNEYELSKL